MMTKVSRAEFLAVYVPELQIQINTNPEYAGLTDANLIGHKMYASLLAGTANKDGKAIQRTLKRLGIKNTYKAIKEALS